MELLKEFICIFIAALFISVATIVCCQLVFLIIDAICELIDEIIGE